MNAHGESDGDKQEPTKVGKVDRAVVSRDLYCEAGVIKGENRNEKREKWDVSLQNIDSHFHFQRSPSWLVNSLTPLDNCVFGKKLRVFVCFGLVVN